jgi:hypothetical protein
MNPMHNSAAIYNHDTYTLPLINYKTKEVCFDINGRGHYVRVSDPYGNLTNRQLKSKAWAHLKKIAIVTIS